MNRRSLSASACATRHWRLRPLVLSLACIGAGHAFAQTLPIGPTVMGGTFGPGNFGTSAIGSGPGQRMDINQASLRGVIHWHSFSIGAFDQVQITQSAGPSSVLLNRVTGSGGPIERSLISGALNANGRVFLVNPSGIVFANGAKVNVGGLVASTLDLADAQIMNSDNNKFDFAGLANSSARVRVEQGASIATNAPGGTVALLGGLVRNEGQIQVARGSAGLVSASKVSVDFNGDGLTTFVIPADGGMDLNLQTVQAGAEGVDKSTTAQVMNGATGAVQADGGRIVLMGSATVAQQVVNQSGTLRAQSLVQRGGEIVLEARAPEGWAASNQMTVAGRVDADAQGPGVAGGQIRTSADRLMVLADSQISAAGGGGKSGGNGVWTAEAAGVFRVTATDAAPEGDTASRVNGGAVGSTLAQRTDVTLTRTGSVQVDSLGLVFDEGAQVLKDAGGNAVLRVNSTANIGMETGARIAASQGALQVEFNADSLGLAASKAGAEGGPAAAIRLQNARIDANGGDILFYGQSKEAGRAMGGVVKGLDGDVDDVVRSGVWLGDSQLTTTQDGRISLRGQGGLSGGTFFSSGDGVSLTGTSALQTERGAIDLRGLGAVGAAGVRLQGGVGADHGVNVASASGDLLIAGATAGWSAASGSPALLTSQQQSAGVRVDNAALTTGGNATIKGSGADLSALAAEQSALATASKEAAVVNASHGVFITGSQVKAGVGKTLDVIGTMGSKGLAVDVTGAVLPEPTTLGTALTPFAVAIESSREIDGLRAEGGMVRLQGGEGDVWMQAGAYNRSLVDVSSATAKGGQFIAQGRNAVAQAAADAAILADARGVGQGGSILIQGTAPAGDTEAGIVAIGHALTLDASSTGGAGNGGSIRVLGERSVLAHGTLVARGSDAGGNGGFIETSGATFNLSGVQVDAGAKAGQGGTWLVDPYDVLINGTGSITTLPANPFVPLSKSNIQDVAISNALNAGTDVTISVAPGGGTDVGDIRMEGARIYYNAGSGERTFTLNAHNSVRSDGNVVIAGAGAGRALNVVFNADANNGGPATGGGQISFSGSIYSNGGDVSMKGAAANDFAAVSVNVDGLVIDTRQGNTQTLPPLGGPLINSGGSDLLPGGSLSIIGRTNFQSPFNTYDGVRIDGTQVRTSTGDIDVLGTATTGSGVLITGPNLGAGLRTTSGDIRITGVGGYSPSSAYSPGHGVVVGVGGAFDPTGGPSLVAVDGDIQVRGLSRTTGSGPGQLPGAGVFLDAGVQVRTSGQGRVELTGETQGAVAGVELSPAKTYPSATPAPLAPARVDSQRDVVIRAANNGAGDAFVTGVGASVSAAGAINVRPGGLDASGAADALAISAVDRVGQAIRVGGADGTGLSISTDDLSRLSTPTLVIGGSTHAADITVAGAITRTGALTLQNPGINGGGWGRIDIEAPITVDRLGLVAAGTVAQSSAGAITAQTLLARSDRESVLLDQAANNVSAATLGGSAAQAFRYQDVDALQLGSVSVTGFNAASNQPQTISATSMQAQTVFVRTLSGDLSLAADVSSTSGADLVAGSRFVNVGSYRITGAPWRVWANSWAGESRGGMAGTGTLPNLYNCTYAGACGVSIPAGDSHFIYTQQPLATVTITGAARGVGEANPALGYTLGGLILGDTGAGITGTLVTPADSKSPAGSYPINGTFTSAEGYAIQVVPGTLVVRAPPVTEPPVTQPPVTDPPVTQPPVTQPPVTQPPVTQPPVTQPPVTQPPVTQPPVTQPPVTQPPVTQPPVTQPPLIPDAGFPFQPRDRSIELQVLSQAVQTFDLLRDLPNTYTFDRNMNAVPICFPSDQLAGDRVLPGEDTLSREWTKVRSRPNLINCIDTGREDGCGDF